MRTMCNIFGQPSVALKLTWTPFKTDLSVLVRFSPKIAVLVLKPTQAYRLGWLCF